MTTPYLSEIRIFAFNFPPRGWATCSGQILPIQQNAALFSLLGTTYGGNGVTTFALPNLQSRVPMHFGQGPGLSNRTLGEASGEENHTLTINEMPAHVHTLQGTTTGATTGTPAASVALATPSASKPYRSGATPTAWLSSGIAGSGLPHANIQPYLTVNFAIALQGIFPSRN
jgi:microcystin-dependent protein